MKYFSKKPASYPSAEAQFFFSAFFSTCSLKIIVTAVLAGSILPVAALTPEQQLQMRMMQVQEGLSNDRAQCRDLIPTDIEVANSEELGCSGLETSLNDLESFKERVERSALDTCINSCSGQQSEADGCERCNSVCTPLYGEFEQIWKGIEDIIKNQVNDTVNHGKGVCRCCDFPQRCLVGNSVVGGVLSVLTSPAMSAVTTVTAAGTGHRKSCRVLKTMNWATAGLNGFAAIKCRRKGGKCRVHHQQCLTVLRGDNGSDGDEDSEGGVLKKLEDIQEALKEKYLSNNSDFENCSELDQEVKDAIEDLEEQIKEINDNKKHCEDAVTNSETLQQQAGANTMMGAIAHKCSEDKDNDDEKNCWINTNHPKYPNCSDKSLECILNPSAEGCGEVDCNAHPTHASCQGQAPAECQDNPDSDVCRAFCNRNPSHSVCQRFNPRGERCNPGDENCSNLALLDDEETNDNKALPSNVNNENEKGDPDFAPFSALPTPKIPPPDSGGGGSSPLSFGSAGGSGGSPGGGGGASSGGGGEPGEGEGEEGGSEPDPYANLLAGLSSGKPKGGAGGPSLTSGSGGRNRSKDRAAKGKKGKKFNLKNFLPKKKGRKVASVKSLSKSIFDIHTDMVRSYCNKNKVTCR